MVKPQEVVETVCPKACVIRLNDNEEDEYQLDAADVVSIEDGFLYYDNPEAGDDKDKPGAGATPPEKKKP